MNVFKVRCLILATMLVAGIALSAPAEAQTASSQGLVVVVNNEPITDYDVEQRMRFKQVLGMGQGSASQQRKEALEDLIDDVIKKSVAKRNQVEPSDAQIEEAIARMAAAAGTTVSGLSETLQAKGVSTDTLRQYVAATIAFNAITARKYNLRVSVDESEIDRRLDSMMSDPRFKPVTVYEIMEISLPLDQTSQAMMRQLLQARAVEAQQIIRRFDGCSSARAAASGIYNVKIGDPVQADAEQMPEQMKQALDQVGPGNALGPMRTPQGVQVVGFCGRRTIEPPKPDRETVESILRNEKYQRASERILRNLRRSAYIDYKDKPGAGPRKPPERAKTAVKPKAVKPKEVSQEDSAIRQTIERLQNKIEELESQ